MLSSSYHIRLHHSLICPILLAGTPRRFAILNGTLSAIFLLGLHLFYLAPCFLLTHLIAVFLTKQDPYFFDILLSYIRQKKYYRT